jgi:prepilin-type N-terminal cleavage/methylation domain-containing protein
MRRAFTLVELLVVIAIFVLLLAIAVPAFSSMLYSSEQSLAENSVRIGLQAARDAALRNAAGKDAAAVFFFDRFTGRTSILPCTFAAIVKDEDQNSPVDPPPLVDREVFVPVAGFEPVQLPRGWNIRGYAGPRTIDTMWYERTYPSNTARNRGNWVFPETSFYDEDAGDDGTDRQTFMVRFEGSTGVLKVSDAAAVLVLSPSPSTTFRSSSPWNNPALRADTEPDYARFVRRVASRPAAGAGSLTVLARQELIGDVASDTVLTRPVSQVAVYSEKKLAQALGARTDSATGCLYQNLPDPTFINVGGSPMGDTDVVRINDWVEGHLLNPTPPALPASQYIDSDCRVFALQKYLGTLQEMTGTLKGQGVTSQ